MTIIAFVGSVFSPYYAWSGWRDPENHCAVNVALYGPRGGLWTMTERGRATLSRDAATLRIGTSVLAWDGRGLVIDFDEIAAPLPHRVAGRVRVEPAFVNLEGFSLSASGGHRWRPIAPVARVSLEATRPGLSWSGEGYFDMNAGDEPLEAAFRHWTWSRARLRSGAVVLYEAARHGETPLSMALRFDARGGFERAVLPPYAALPLSRWRLASGTRSDDGAARVVRTFEDGPFYARRAVEHRLFGEAATSMHETLSLDRFRAPIVRAMLPFRMPRALRAPRRG